MKQKSIGVQYLRAFSCISVFLSHLLGSMPNGMQFGNVNLNSTPLRIIWGGYSGVIIFFVISGFFQEKNSIQLSIKGYFDYVIKRHLRIYPAFLLVFVISILARITFIEFDATLLSPWVSDFWKDTVPLKQYIMSIFLVSPFDADLLNPAIWTLRIELRMCFFFPYVHWLTRRLNPFLVYLVSVLLGAFVPFFAYLPVFVLGMIANQYKDKVLECIRDKKVFVVIIALLLLDFSYICNWINLDAPAPIRSNITALGAVTMVLCLYEITSNRTRIGKVLISLGDKSYYIYLVHMVVLLWFRFVCQYIGFVGYVVVVTAVTYALAMGVYMFDAWIHEIILNNMISRKYFSLYK